MLVLVLLLYTTKDDRDHSINAAEKAKVVVLLSVLSKENEGRRHSRRKSRGLGKLRDYRRHGSHLFISSVFLR